MRIEHYNKTKKAYSKPTISVFELDRDIALIQMSPGEPYDGDPPGGGGGGGTIGSPSYPDEISYPETKTPFGGSRPDYER